jgi:hypothetical protein
MIEPGPRLRSRWLDPLLLLELFLVNNVAFLAVDIAIAHAVNAFANPAEWVPIGFSAAGTVVLLLAMALGGLVPTLPGQETGQPGVGRRRLARGMGLLVGGGAVAVGVAGLILHLDSQFFEEQTLKNLVYTAPFVAPLAYAGVGLLLILDRMVDSATVEWARWVVVMALGGFVGNFVLTLSDHAQNGFFAPTEWIGVVASAAAIGVLTAVVIVFDNRPLLRLCLAVLGLQVAVGLLGFGLHVAANLAKPAPSVWDRFLFGAPAFAPLLFADLAVLGALGLWGLERTLPGAGAAHASAAAVASGG